MILPGGRYAVRRFSVDDFGRLCRGLRRASDSAGGVVVSGGYSSWRGPYCPYFYSPLFYDPFYAGFFHPGYYGGFGYAQNSGRVKLPTEAKDAIVFLDGAYAGPVSKLKNMWLEPGRSNL